MNAAKQATPHSELIEQLMDSRVPKTEREHAARREIEMLREALRLPAALDAPESEPVAWELRKGKTDRVLLEITNNAKRAHDWKCSLEEIVPLYTRPQPAAPREWVGLTDEEVSKILDREIGFNSCFGPETNFARAIEAKLKEKNT